MFKLRLKKLDWINFWYGSNDWKEYVYESIRYVKYSKFIDWQSESTKHLSS
jgi:hypothetical protein